MGYNCRKQNVLVTLAALEACLRAQGFRAPPGEGVDAAQSKSTERPASDPAALPLPPGERVGERGA